MAKRTQLFVVIMLLLCVVSACSSSDEETSINNNEPSLNGNNENNRDDSEAGANNEEPEVEHFDYYAPLTGIGGHEPFDERVVTAVFDNNEKARPHTGLIDADIVYEMLVEGDNTRLFAVFQSQHPAVIGPIRSLRPYFNDLVLGFDSAVAHAGGSDLAKAELSERGIASLDGLSNAEPYFQRVSFRSAPHNLYTGMSELREAIEARGYRTDATIPTLSFRDVADDVEGRAADSVTVTYGSYHVSFEYDPLENAYMRFASGVQQIDHESEQPLRYDNVLIMETSHRTIEHGWRVIDVLSSGNALLFQQGVVQEVEWRNEDGVIRPYQNGVEVALTPGKTWVNVVPSLATDTNY